MPYLVVALECDRPCAGSASYSLDRVQSAYVGRGPERGASRREDRLDVTIPSPSASAAHARFVRTGAEWIVEDLGSTNGTFVNGAQSARERLSEADVVTIGRTLLSVVASRLTPIGSQGDRQSSGAGHEHEHVTLDPELEAQLGALHRVARSDIAVLIRGETGTGKELLARSVHAKSERAGPFVAVNCGALPAGLVESQLFGHVKGAFSGALRDEPGLFRAADRGTLFLDEVGDLPLPAQVALLRALQEREVVPVGGTKPVRVDLRVVAATHQPLDEMVARGAFRRDLLGRLNGFAIELPPLRARRMDFGVIVSSLLRRLAGDRADAVRFTPAAGVALLRYAWPLNTRELEQCLARALVLAGDQAIQLEHLPPAVTQTPAPTAPVAEGPLVGVSARDARLRAELLDQLARHKGNLADVARAMGKARMQIHRWCKRLGIDPDVYRS